MTRNTDSTDDKRARRQAQSTFTIPSDTKFLATVSVQVDLSQNRWFWIRKSLTPWCEIVTLNITEGQVIINPSDQSKTIAVIRPNT